MYFSFRCDGNKYESLELGIYISSCTEEQKEKYKMPINIVCEAKLTGMEVRESVMWQLIKLVLKFLSQNKIKWKKIK